MDRGTRKFKVLPMRATAPKQRRPQNTIIIIIMPHTSTAHTFHEGAMLNRWAPCRRGPHTKRHYALEWEPGTTTAPAVALITVCHKRLYQYRNAKDDPTVADLPECSRCLTSGPQIPFPECPGSSA